MEELWEYSGQVWVDRVGDNAGGLLYLPWVVYSPIDEPLTEQQLQDLAFQIAADFLNAFQSSDQERRSQFGDPSGFEITSILTVIR